MSTRYGNRPSKSYQLAKRARQATNKRWSPDERRLVLEGVLECLTVEQIHAMLPHRTQKAVMLIMYEIKGPQDRDTPASLNDVRRDKDAREGSRALLEAMIRAFPNMFGQRLAG